MSKNKILDLGCGNKKRDGTIGIDFNERIKSDNIYDLNEFPYPFESHFIPLDEISFLRRL
jgi:hypothetical protein